MAELPHFDVFLCYHSPDRRWVREIAEALQRADVRPWLDAWHGRPGRQFQAQLAGGLHSSSACAVCIGKEGLSGWMKEELDVAIDRQTKDPDFLVIPILLPGLAVDFDTQSLPAFLRMRHWVDLRDGIDQPTVLGTLINEIKGRAPTQQARSEPRVQGEYSARESEGNHRMTTHHSHSAILAPIAPLVENVAILQRHIRDLTFTPVIGAGCSLVGRLEGDAWFEVAAEMRYLLTLLREDERAAAYVRALAAVPAYDVPLESIPRSDKEYAPPEDLVALQVSLARLGAEFGLLFARTMLESAAPVWDTISYALPVRTDYQGLEHIAELLLSAAKAAYALKHSPEGRNPASGLGATGLYDRLIEVAGELVDDGWLNDHRHDEHHHDGHLHVIHDMRAKRRRVARFQDFTHSGHIEVSIHQLEWFADALWHTFRYNKAAYPRTDELAFQVSLLATGAHGRRPDLVSAAEMGQVNLSADTVAAWFQTFSQSQAPKMLEFYHALAHILHAQFENYQRHTSRQATDSSDSLRWIEPVVFSMNYDLEMEHALQRVDSTGTFHVVIPVNAFAPDDDEPELEWLFGTVHRRGPVEAPVWEWFSRKRRLLPREVKGPIVIKLHGSPLHELPEPDDLMHSGHGAEIIPEYEFFKHALILSEGQYLQAAIWKDPLPEFFNTILLQKKRSWFFLGHSVKEWNTRMHLYTQVYRKNSPPTSADRIAINRSHDPYRSAVLSSMGIQRWIGELEAIAESVDVVLAQEVGR